jgi:hypothetical protein
LHVGQGCQTLQRLKIGIVTGPLGQVCQGHVVTGCVRSKGIRPEHQVFDQGVMLEQVAQWHIALVGRVWLSAW